MWEKEEEEKKIETHKLFAIISNVMRQLVGV